MTDEEAPERRPINAPSQEAIDNASRALLEAAYRQGVLSPPPHRNPTNPT